MLKVVASIAFGVVAIAMTALIVAGVIFLIINMYGAVRRDYPELKVFDMREQSCERCRAADIRRARSPKKIRDSHSRDIKQRKEAVNPDAIEKRGSKEVRKPVASP